MKKEFLKYVSGVAVAAFITVGAPGNSSAEVIGVSPTGQSSLFSLSGGSDVLSDISDYLLDAATAGCMQQHGVPNCAKFDKEKNCTPGTSVKCCHGQVLKQRICTKNKVYAAPTPLDSPSGGSGGGTGGTGTGGQTQGQPAPAQKPAQGQTSGQPATPPVEIPKPPEGSRRGEGPPLQEGEIRLIFTPVE